MTRLSVTALLFLAADARDVSTLLSERVRCEEAADGGDGCSPTQYVEVLVELGDEHVQLGDREQASESYEEAAKHSFVKLGKESAMHTKALLRLASHQLNAGDYEAASKLLSGWLRTYSTLFWLDARTPSPDDNFNALDVLAKQAEALSLGGQLAEAKPALETLLGLLAQGGDAADRFGQARTARMHMFMSNVLQTGGGDENEEQRLEDAKQHLTRALELHKAGAEGDKTSVEASMCANMKAALLRTPQPPSPQHAFNSRGGCTVSSRLHTPATADTNLVFARQRRARTARRRRPRPWRRWACKPRPWRASGRTCRSRPTTWSAAAPTPRP